MKLLKKIGFTHLLFLLVAGAEIHAQVDTLHYIPPLYYTGDNNSDFGDHYFILSTFETTPFTVTVRNNDNSFSQTYSLSKSTPIQVNLGTRFNAEGLIGPTQKNTVLDQEGLIFSGSKPFFVNITHKTNIQATILTSKGTVGLGKLFYTGHMYTVFEGNNPNNSRNKRRAHFISVMASENNTYVTFSNPRFTFDGHPTNPFTVILQKGQSYVVTKDFYQSGLNNTTINDINGTKVSSNKPIAVNTGTWTAGMDPNLRDIGSDQIVPVEIIGNEYIVMRGEGSNKVENLIVVGTKPNTEIYLNGSGSSFATLTNAGEYVIIPENRYNSDDIVYINATEPIYVFQSLAGSTNNATTGMLFLPRLSCNVSKSVQISYANFLGNPDLKLVTQAGSTITINGVTISGAVSVPGNPNWEAYSVTESTLSTCNPGADWNFTVSSTGALNAALTIESGAIGAGGFYSGFGTVPEISYNPVLSSQGLCSGNTELRASGYSEYSWYKDGVIISGVTDSVYQPTTPGRYKVVGITSCAGQPSLTYPSKEIKILPCISFNPTSLNITEGNVAQPNAQFNIELSNPWNEDIVRVDYTTQAGTASQGNDYTQTSGTASIPAGSTSATVNVPILNDLLAENNETFSEILANPINAVISDSTAICTIIDDGDPDPVLNLQASRDVNEDANNVTFSVTLSKLSGKTITVDYTISDLTTTINEDYSTANSTGTLTFLPGEQTKNLSFSIINDNIYEPGPRESFRITLSNVVNATSGNLSSTCNIADNETIPTLIFNVTNASEGQTIQFNGTLSNPCDQNVTFTYLTSDSTANSPADYTAISTSVYTITPGATSLQISVNTIDDIITEGVEIFRLSMLNLNNAVFSSGLSSHRLNAKILDNEGLPQLSIYNSTIVEGGTLKFPLDVSHPSSTDITFQVTSADGTAVSPGDYSGFATPLDYTINAGITSDTIQINTVDDGEEELSENFTLTLINLSANAEFPDSVATGTITDNDETPIANEDNFAVDEDNVLNSNVLVNDNGLGDAPVIISGNTSPQHGSVSFDTNTGDIEYTPDANFNGIDSLQYTIRDADGDESTAWIFITVNSINDIPVAVNDVYTINENTSLSDDVTSNDTGLGDGFTISLVSGVSSGSLTLNTDGSFTYTPEAQFYGQVQFVYRITDSNLDNSSATATINVTFSNDFDPVALNDTISTPEDTPVDIVVLYNDYDQDGNETIDVGSVLIKTSPSNGTAVTQPSGIISFTPDADYQGSDQFTYSIRDADGRESNDATVFIEITADNDVPVAIAKDTITLYLNNSGTASITAAVVDDGSYDPDGDPLTMLLSKSSFSCANKGMNNVTFTVKDPLNAQDNDICVIEVLDTIRPVLKSSPSDTVISADAGVCGAVFNYQAPVFSDNCDGDQTGDLDEGYTSGSVFPIGTTNVKFSYTDQSGNGPVSISFTITVIDYEHPVLTCQDEVLETNNGNMFDVSDNSLDPLVSENCTFTLTHDYNGGGSSLNGESFATGDHTVTWIVTDNSGNADTCIQSITVYEPLTITLTSNDADLQICALETIIFSAGVNGGVPSYTYDFLVNGISVTAGVSGNEFTANNLNDGDEVEVIVEDSLTNSANSNSIIVTVNDVPVTGSLYRDPNN